MSTDNDNASAVKNMVSRFESGIDLATPAKAVVDGTVDQLEKLSIEGKLSTDEDAEGEAPAAEKIEQETSNTEIGEAEFEPTGTAALAESEPTQDVDASLTSEQDKNSPVPDAGEGDLPWSDEETGDKPQDDAHFSDEFDDFGEPVEANEDDFGDFDDFDDFAEPATAAAPEEAPVKVPEPAPQAKVACLSEVDFGNSVNLQASIAQILKPIYTTPETVDSSTLDSASYNSDSEADITSSQTSLPKLITTTAELSTSAVEEDAESPSYFTERSASLWNQLAIVQPQAMASTTDWKRSAIRRLFMVSLGVPLDLDEILPQKNTKRLVLPAVQSHRGRRGSRSHSATRQPDGASTPREEKKSNGQGQDLEADTDKNLQDWHQLAVVSDIALTGMSKDELASHIAALKAATESAAKTLEIWEKKKQTAIKDKDDFESLIESLVEYAQRSGSNKGKKKK